jgi:hypothetical protein
MGVHVLRPEGPFLDIRMAELPVLPRPIDALQETPPLLPL